MAEYRAPKRVFKIIDFPESMGEGLVVRARSISLGKLLDLQSMASLMGKSATELDADDIQSVNKLFKLFAECLVDWNLVDEDGPVPPTFEGLLAQDFDWVNKLIEVWMTSTIGVSAPLDLSSIAGKQSEEALLPMATRYGNLAS